MIIFIWLVLNYRNSYLLGILSKSEMNNKTITDEITYGTRLEVFCESVPQLVLQFYYFSHGQELGKNQICSKYQKPD